MMLDHKLSGGSTRYFGVLINKTWNVDAAELLIAAVGVLFFVSLAFAFQ
jgi:hypothetical protein